ncbi:putative BSD domain superfamily protein [Helianthus debilis subsp. tardiflorus]
MSHVQNDHALAIQELVPNLTTLRHTIHNHMTEQQFWIIYFVLLVPRLNADDYRLLSTPQIVRVRETVLQKLRNNKNMATGCSCSCSDDTRDEKGSMVNSYSTEQSENPFQDAATNRKSEDDVSFNDLDDETSSGVKRTQSWRFSSASENSDWVRLGGTLKVKRCERRSESEGSSSDWHAVEDVDL